MFKQIWRWFGLAGLLSVAAVPAVAADQCPPLLNHVFPRLQDGQPYSLCKLRDKVILVVNTASYCGFTGQYEPLEKLYERLAPRGLVVLGFPSNDFGEQEPGSDREIAEFCRLTYGVEFPMLAKSTVKGAQANPFYRQLADLTGSKPRWNFHKYLINRGATQVAAFGSLTKPDDPALLAKLEAFLATPPEGERR